MALFDDASLVVTPNGYKAGTLYSIKPTSGAGDMTVVRATTATRVNSAGLIESVANNVPRLDYSNGTCPSILVEPQSTNLLTWSEDFTNATYTKIGVTATGNTTTSPDGTTNADSILEIATGGTHQSWQRASMTSGQLYTQSCFLKANGRNRVVMQIFDNSTQYASAIYDLSTGVVVASVGTATIQSMGNGWHRCTITGTSPATGLGYCVLGLCESTYTNSSVMPSYSGDASKGGYWWGFQVENSSYPTSYIPTTSAAVTRNADEISKTGISALIGQTSGTVFLELETTENLYAYIGVDDGTTSNRIIFFGVGDNKLYAQLRDSSGTIWTQGSSVINGKVKGAIAFTSSDSVFYVNGVQVYSLTGASYSTLSQFTFNHASQIGAEVNSAVLFPTRLTNAELATLTTI